MNIHLLWAAIAVLVTGYPLMLVAFQRAAARARAEAKQAFVRASQMLAEENANLKLEIERSHAVADEARAKTARYFVKISEFEREREVWQKSYFEQSIGHGNAQQLMMNTIDGLSRQLQAKGVRVQLPKVLSAVREEFLTEHEMPARAAMEAIAAVEAAKAATETQVTAEAPAT